MNLPMAWRKFNERYNLIGNKCMTCGREFFPPRVVCPNCGRKGELKPKQMPHTGKIISYTEVFTSSTGFENQTPYFLAIIELDNGVKVLSQIVDSPSEMVKINSRVKLVFRKIADTDPKGVILYGYKFKVVE